MEDLQKELVINEDGNVEEILKQNSTVYTILKFRGNPCKLKLFEIVSRYKNVINLQLRFVGAFSSNEFSMRKLLKQCENLETLHFSGPQTFYRNNWFSRTEENKLKKLKEVKLKLHLCDDIFLQNFFSQTPKLTKLISYSTYNIDRLKFQMFAYMFGVVIKDYTNEHNVFSANVECAVTPLHHSLISENIWYFRTNGLGFEDQVSGNTGFEHLINRPDQPESLHSTGANVEPMEIDAQASNENNEILVCGSLLNFSTNEIQTKNPLVQQGVLGNSNDANASVNFKEACSMLNSKESNTVLSNAGEIGSIELLNSSMQVANLNSDSTNEAVNEEYYVDNNVEFEDLNNEDSDSESCSESDSSFGTEFENIIKNSNFENKLNTN